ncbi:MAG: sulfite exporter TauE/SafE family protein [Pseudomonadota bacterium]
MPFAEPLVLSSPLIAVAVLAIVFIGAVVQVGLGMGFGLTVAPVLALLDPALVPGSALFLGMATAMVGAFHERDQIVWPEVGIGMVGRATGMVCGGILLLWLSDRSLFSLTFGVMVLLAVALTVSGRTLPFTTRNLLSMGWLSGLTGIVTSVGAPPLALIYHSKPPDKARPTLAAFFALGGLIGLTILYATGLAGWMTFAMALFMAPAAVLGTWVGRHTKNKFDKRYRPALLAIAAAASIFLIFQGVTGLAP